MTSDAQLIALAREARHEGLELLYRTHRAKIYTFLLRLTGDADAADDLTQDTFVKAFHALAQLHDGGKVLPWLYRIASNTAIDQARRRKRIPWQPLLSLLGRPDEPHAADEHTTLAEREHIAATLRSIPVENAAALLLHVLEGYSYREIGEIQGVSMTAVRSRIARARTSFRELHATDERSQTSSG